MPRPCATIDEYISAFPDEVQRILERVRRTARQAAPAVGETISYGMPTITFQGSSLVSFAAWKRWLGLYPVPAVEGDLAQALAPYRAARSTLRFPLSIPIPYDLIGRLVVLHVQQRLGEAVHQVAVPERYVQRRSACPDAEAAAVADEPGATGTDHPLGHGPEPGEIELLGGRGDHIR